MDMSTFAERLKYVRLQRNISVDELAEAVKVNRSTINRYETAGFKSIKEDRLEAIANYLSVDKDYLCGKIDNQFTLKSLENLNKKHHIEINSVITITKDLIKQKNVTLEGKPVTDIDYLIDAMELALEMLKRKNKGDK